MVENVRLKNVTTPVTNNTSTQDNDYANQFSIKYNKNTFNTNVTYHMKTLVLVKTLL